MCTGSTLGTIDLAAAIVRLNAHHDRPAVQVRFAVNKRKGSSRGNAGCLTTPGACCKIALELETA